MPPLKETDDFSILQLILTQDRSIVLLKTMDGLGVCVVFENQRYNPLGVAYRLGEPNGFDAAVQYARNISSRSVFIHPHTMELIPWTVQPEDHPESFPGILSPHLDLPIFDKPNLRFIETLRENLSSKTKVSVVQLGDGSDDLYVFKSCHSSSHISLLQDEADNYIKLRDSPYILPIRGLVRCDEWSIEFNDSNVPIAVQKGVLCGILLPFCGDHSILWFPNEWKCSEKEVLAVALIDAVLDITRRGVNLCDLKGLNILLTPRGLCLIDLDSLTTTTGYGDFGYFNHPLKQTVYNLGIALAELFSETGPLEHNHGPSMFTEVYEKTFKMLRSIRSRTRVTVSSLARLRYTRIARQAQSYDEAWLGSHNQSVPWSPRFTQEDVRPVFILVKSHLFVFSSLFLDSVFQVTIQILQ